MKSTDYSDLPDAPIGPNAVNMEPDFMDAQDEIHYLRSSLAASQERVRLLTEALNKVVREMDEDCEGGSCGHEGLRELLTPAPSAPKAEGKCECEGVEENGHYEKNCPRYKGVCVKHGASNCGQCDYDPDAKWKPTPKAGG